MSKITIHPQGDNALVITTFNSTDPDATNTQTLVGDQEYYVEISDDSGEALIVHAKYEDAVWRMSVGTDAERGRFGYPSWSVSFGERPGYEGDPAVVIFDFVRLRAAVIPSLSTIGGRVGRS